VRAGTRQQRHLPPLGHFARDQRQGARVASVNRRELVARDQPVGLRADHGGIALHVGEDQVERGAAQRLDPAAVIDHPDGEPGGIDAALPDLSEAAGDRIQSPDVDRGGRRRRWACDGPLREECTRGDDAASGCGQEPPAGIPPLPCRAARVCHPPPPRFTRTSSIRDFRRGFPNPFRINASNRLASDVCYRWPCGNTRYLPSARSMRRSGTNQRTATKTYIPNASRALTKASNTAAT